VLALTEERTANFEREQNTDDAYTFEEFLEELEEYLENNYGDEGDSEEDKENLAHLREHPEIREDIWAGVCDDLEEYYEEKVLCGWCAESGKDCQCDDSGESYKRSCMECDEYFTPSVEHARDGVCDECVCEKGKKQILITKIDASRLATA
jgi:hypothetical protein